MKPTTPVLIAALALSAVAVGRSQAQQPQEFQGADVQLMKRYKDAVTCNEKAKGYYAKKEYEQAEEQAGTCLERMPELADAHLLMAKVMYVKKDYLRSLGHIEEAERHFGAMAGLIANMQQDRLSALRQRRRAQEDGIGALRSELTRTSAEGQLALRQKIDEAERLVAEIDRELNAPLPDPVTIPAEYHFFHGNVLLRLQKYSEAAAKYEQALVVDPMYADAVNNLASLYYSARQHERALDVLTQAEARGVAVNTELKKAVLEGLGR